MTCDQEMCRNWTGHGCACDVLDLDKHPAPPTEGFWAGVRPCDACDRRARWADAYGWWCDAHADQGKR